VGARQVSIPSVRRMSHIRIPQSTHTHRRSYSYPDRGSHFGRREYVLFGYEEGNDPPDPETTEPLAIFGSSAEAGDVVLSITDGKRYYLRLYSRSAYGKLSAYTETSVYRDGDDVGPKPSPTMRANVFQRDNKLVVVWDCVPAPGAVPDSFKLFRAEDLGSVIGTVNYSSPRRHYQWSETPTSDGQWCYVIRSYKDGIYDNSLVVVCGIYDSTAHADPSGDLTLTQES